MHSCYNCGYLDKTRREVGKNCFRYGCNRRKGYICGWCFSDSHLKASALGCSDWIPIKTEIAPLNEISHKQLTIDDWLGGAK